MKIDWKLRNKQQGRMYYMYNIDVICVYNGHMFYTKL